jgi:hypothetical protein
MSDYSKAACDLKRRWDTSAAKGAHLMAFFESMRSALSREVERANSALDSEDLPNIEFKKENPIEIACVGSKCEIHLVSDLNMILVNFASRSGEKSLRFSIQECSDPPMAHEICHSAAAEEEFAPREVAAAVIEELIAGAP